MKVLIKTAVVGLILTITLSCPAAKKLKVVASTLDMADLARQVGEDKISVYAVSTGKYDLHFFDPRPSQVMKLRSADLLIVGDWTWTSGFRG